MRPFNPDTDEERFSVCGWSKKHRYYRNKDSVHTTEQAAKDALYTLRLDPNWRIRTIIVREIFYDKKGQNVDHISADQQQRLWSNTCKHSNTQNTRYRDYGRFTY